MSFYTVEGDKLVYSAYLTYKTAFNLTIESFNNTYSVQSKILTVETQVKQMEQRSSEQQIKDI